MARRDDGIEEEKLQLEQELLDVENSLLGEIHMIEVLVNENNRKRERIRELEGQVVADKNRGQHETNMCLDERDTAMSGLEHQRTILESQLWQVQLKHKTCEDVVAANEFMRNEIDKMLEKAEEANSERGTTAMAMSSQLLGVREGLQKAFRKALEDLSGTYDSKAFQGLDEDLKQALLDNANMQEELALQEIGITSLSQRSKSQRKEVARLSREKRKLENATKEQLKEYTAAHSERLAKEEELRKVEEMMADAETATAALKARLRKSGVEVISRTAMEDMLQQQNADLNCYQTLEQTWVRRKADAESASIAAFHARANGASSMRMPAMLKKRAELLLKMWAEEDSALIDVIAAGVSETARAHVSQLCDVLGPPKLQRSSTSAPMNSTASMSTKASLAAARKSARSISKLAGKTPALRMSKSASLPALPRGEDYGALAERALQRIKSVEA